MSYTCFALPTKPSKGWIRGLGSGKEDWGGGKWELKHSTSTLRDKCETQHVNTRLQETRRSIKYLGMHTWSSQGEA